MLALDCFDNYVEHIQPISEREISYESVIKFKNQNGEKRHTDALLHAYVMGPPQIRTNKRIQPLGYTASP